MWTANAPALLFLLPCSCIAPGLLLTCSWPAHGLLLPSSCPLSSLICFTLLSSAPALLLPCPSHASTPLLLCFCPAPAPAHPSLAAFIIFSTSWLFPAQQEPRFMVRASKGRHHTWAQWLYNCDKIKQSSADSKMRGIAYTSRCKRAARLVFTPFLDTFLAICTLIFVLPGFLLSHGMTINLITNIGCRRCGSIDSRLWKNG